MLHLMVSVIGGACSLARLNRCYPGVPGRIAATNPHNEGSGHQRRGLITRVLDKSLGRGDLITAGPAWPPPASRSLAITAAPDLASAHQVLGGLSCGALDDYARARRHLEVAYRIYRGAGDLHARVVRLTGRDVRRFPDVVDLVASVRLLSGQSRRATARRPRRRRREPPRAAGDRPSRRREGPNRAAAR